MGNFNYPRHFTVLGVAAVLLFLIGHWDLLGDSLVASFAINGLLHASSLVFALRSPQSRLRRIAFIAIAGGLSIFTLYVGIIGLVLFAMLPGTERLYLDLGLCALSGAITYGSLVRIFWVRSLGSRQVLAMAIGCMIASSLAFLSRSYLSFLGGWWLAAVWWFAFSGALWFCDTHSGALGRRGTLKSQGGTTS
ncbi:MAG TPA: hypothetical protein VHW71_02395 [Steroidobacteraceae bacterium]|jgi:hypothetical protein|nr:hypothetical protein [Steroidobacteraceae bacterium]